MKSLMLLLKFLHCSVLTRNTALISSPSGVFTAARPAATNWFTEEKPVEGFGGLGRSFKVEDSILPWCKCCSTCAFFGESLVQVLDRQWGAGPNMFPFIPQCSSVCFFPLLKGLAPLVLKCLMRADSLFITATWNTRTRRQCLQQIPNPVVAGGATALKTQTMVNAHVNLSYKCRLGFGQLHDIGWHTQNNRKTKLKTLPNNAFWVKKWRIEAQKHVTYAEIQVLAANKILQVPTAMHVPSVTTWWAKSWGMSEARRNKAMRLWISWRLNSWHVLAL